MNRQSESKASPFIIAALVMLAGVFLYDVMSAIIKHLGENYSAAQLSLFRNVFGLIPTVLILYFSKKWVEVGRPLRIRQWQLALSRGGVGALAQLAVYAALPNLEFATAATILFASPLFVTALSVPVRGKSVGFLRWFAVLIGFVGVLMVMRPEAGGLEFYAMLALCAAFGFGVTSVTSGLIDEDVPTPLVNLYYSVGTIVGAILIVLFSGDFKSVETAIDWYWLLAVGFAGGLGAFCWTTAFRMAEPSSLAPFQYFGLPSSFLIGWVAFGEAPVERLLPGVILIVGGGLLIMWRERQLKKTQ